MSEEVKAAIESLAEIDSNEIRAFILGFKSGLDAHKEGAAKDGEKAADDHCGSAE